MYTYMYIQYMYNTQRVQNSTESLTHMHTHALCPTHLFIFKQPHEYTSTRMHRAPPMTLLYVRLQTAPLPAPLSLLFPHSLDAAAGLT